MDDSCWVEFTGLLSDCQQMRGCGEDENTHAQDDELSLSTNELPPGSDCSESFTLDLPGPPQDQPPNLDRSLNRDYCQPPLDFLDPNCLPRCGSEFLNSLHTNLWAK